MNLVFTIKWKARLSFLNLYHLPLTSFAVEREKGNGLHACWNDVTFWARLLPFPCVQKEIFFGASKTWRKSKILMIDTVFYTSFSPTLLHTWSLSQFNVRPWPSKILKQVIGYKCKLLSLKPNKFRLQQFTEQVIKKMEIQLSMHPNDSQVWDINKIKLNFKIHQTNPKL